MNYNSNKDTGYDNVVDVDDWAMASKTTPRGDDSAAADVASKNRARGSGDKGPATQPGAIKFDDEDDDDDEANDLLGKTEKTTVGTSHNKAGAPGMVKQVTEGGTAGADLEQGGAGGLTKLEKTDTAGTVNSSGAANLPRATAIDQYGGLVEDGNKGVFKTDDGVEYQPGHATEYDPDAKPAHHKLKTFLSTWKGKAVLGLGLIVVAAAIIVPIMVTVGSSKDETPMPVPTMSPTTYREGLGIQEQIEQLIGSAKLQVKDSPEVKALEWILFDDPMQLTADSENLQQRYILSLIYLKTIQDGPWRSCNPPVGNETDECAFKMIITDTPLTFKDEPAIRWMSGRSECEWVGLTCNEKGQITEFWLMASKMSGPFPEEFALLPWMYQLFVVYQELTGPFPMKLLEMKSLDQLALNYMQLTGTVPTELLAMENYRKIQLIGNYFTGQVVIPTPFNLHSCTDLQFFSNELTGTVPTEIGLISNLLVTRWNKNPYLSGPIPTQLGRLTNVELAWFYRTNMTGTIPSQIGGMSALRDWRIFTNDFSGTMPEEIYNLENLENWRIHETNITGTISTSIGKLTNLKGFLAKSTQLTGSIPSEMGELTSLEWLWLQHTHLTGSIPDGICELRNTTQLYQLSVDCLAPEHVLFPKVACSCCVECCVSPADSEEAYCEENLDSII